MNAIHFYRFSRFCHKYKIPLISKLMKILIFLLFNSVIPAHCRIGAKSRFMYGGIGVVIHKNACIGKNVAIGQGVTIGRKLCDGAPTIGDDVYISAGARVLGNITIGSNVIVGANSVVLSDIPSNSVVVGAPAKVVKTLSDNIYEIMGEIL